MRRHSLSSRNFLLSLTASLILHLIILLIILVPSNHRLSLAQDEDMTRDSADFSPSLLITYSPEELESAKLQLEKADALFGPVKNDKVTWEKGNYRRSIQDLLQRQGLTISSVTIPRGQLDERIYSLRIAATTTAKRILSDSLICCLVTGFSTKVSNFRSDQLVILFDDEAGALITVRVETYDCRLFAAGQLTADQMLQRFTLS